MKLCTVLGARPQFIKAATVSRLILKDNSITETIIHTGQHYDSNMSDQFFHELCIPKPKYNLNIGSGLHGVQTGKMLAAVEEVLLVEKPDWLLVYGDTNSTLAGALAASKLHIPVAHVEAGLRSFNRKMPEEINRIMADHLSSLLFTPTLHATTQLKKEGIDDELVHQVGDVMYDAALFYKEYNTQRKTLVDLLSLTPKTYALVTIHRAENTDSLERIEAIIRSLIELSKDLNVILPLHPRTKHLLQPKPIYAELEKHISILDPVGYLDMQALEEHAAVIITDSGGVQKEAYFHRVPCITLRDETEWTELVELGWNQLCPVQNSKSLIDLVEKWVTPQEDLINLYGKGDTANHIIHILKERA